jgi:hypothetical protein
MPRTRDVIPIANAIWRKYQGDLDWAAFKNPTSDPTTKNAPNPISCLCDIGVIAYPRTATICEAILICRMLIEEIGSVERIPLHWFEPCVADDPP